MAQVLRYESAEGYTRSLEKTMNGVPYDIVQLIVAFVPIRKWSRRDANSQ